MMEDRALVSQIIQGNTHAFRILIRQNERLVAYMAGKVVRNREELEEVCQDVFLKVYEKLGEFNFQSRLSTWIATIAYRQAINTARRNKIRFDELPDDDRADSFFVSATDSGQRFEEQDEDNYILKFVEKLPEQYKLVLTLYHVERMNYAEIGAVTGMPEGTIKSYLFRARHMLKERVKSIMHKEPGL